MDFFFGHNPFLSSGLVLMLVGGILFYLKRLPSTLYDLIERFFIVRIEILDDDESFQWMQVWLSDRLRKNLSVSVVTKRQKSDTHGDDDGGLVPGNAKPTIYFVPAVGTYFFWYRGRFVTLSRDRHENSHTSVLGNPNSDALNAFRNKESFTLRIFSRNKALAQALIEECRDKAIPEDGKVEILVARYGSWSVGTRVKARQLSSVILDGNQANELLDDVQAFLRCGDWYREIGVPYRRGYLFHGPPGNGKTSVVKALAGELKMNIYLLMLSDSDMNDNRVNDLLARVPEKSILLLEDIDCAFTQRRRNGSKENGLTFSGLLNALDGVASSEGRIVVMTTNHVERLDPALIRPGRADMKVFFGNATVDQAKRLFERFFPDHAHLADEFASLVEEGKCSMAALQDYLMQTRASPERAIEEVQFFERTPGSLVRKGNPRHFLEGSSTRP